MQPPGTLLYTNPSPAAATDPEPGTPSRLHDHVDELPLVHPGLIAVRFDGELHHRQSGERQFPLPCRHLRSHDSLPRCLDSGHDWGEWIVIQYPDFNVQSN